jgi:hypothetical protein
MQTVAEPEAGAPRWPRDRWISPSTLKNYRTCPYRVRLQDVERVTPPFRYNLNLSKGRIAHLILKRIADALARDRPVIDEAEMLTMARRHLPPQVFPSGDEREAHAREIVRWARYGRSYLERLPDARYLNVEHNETREWAIYPGRAPYTIMARPDVVLLRADEDGTPLIEIIDYKTGKVRPEPEPPVLMRFVGRDLLATHAGRASDARVRFTYLWLNTAEQTRIDLTREHCNDHWISISRELQGLASETIWRLRPSMLCHYCPYYRNACPAVIPPDNAYD